jgi:hypothetical protein
MGRRWGFGFGIGFGATTEGKKGHRDLFWGSYWQKKRGRKEE